MSAPTVTLNVPASFPVSKMLIGSTYFATPAGGTITIPAALWTMASVGLLERGMTVAS